MIQTLSNTFNITGHQMRNNYHRLTWFEAKLIELTTLLHDGNIGFSYLFSDKFLHLAGYLRFWIWMIDMEWQFVYIFLIYRQPPILKTSQNRKQFEYKFEYIFFSSWQVKKIKNLIIFSKILFIRPLLFKLNVK